VMKAGMTLLFAIVAVAPSAWPQTAPENGSNEVQVWTGGGRGLSGSTSNTGVWNLGMRYGWVLTNLHGPGLLRGRFEYAVDVVPVFLVSQSSGTAYGFGLNPLGLKWNLETHGRVVPYLELGGGTLFTNHKVPVGTSRVNFTSSGAFGMHFVRRKYNWSVEVRYMHISSAGLSTPNPGINTLQVRVGIGRFSRP
jgi:lipid A 3-O-deacylase